MMNFDMAAFYENFLRDIRDEQDEEGTVPDTVPHYVVGRRPADPAWGAAYPLIAWYHYVHHGDRRVLETHYEPARKWVDYLLGRASDGVLEYSYYGDWVSIAKTSGAFVSSFFLGYQVMVLAEMARVLGREDDARRYTDELGTVRSAIHDRFYDPARGGYAGGTQTANALALFLGVPPTKEARGMASGGLTKDIVWTHDTHVTTGFIGVKYLMEVLDEIGRNDLAYELVTQTTYPSWGYMIECGATTLWELWQNKSGPSMNSHNHPMFGSVGAWLYRVLAGIRTDPARPGFRRILFRPTPVRDLAWASGSIETIRGRVSCAWRRSHGRFALAASVPTGCEAEVRLPKGMLDQVEVREGGRTVWAEDKFVPGAPGIRAAAGDKQSIIIETGSGDYDFELTGT
jgi:alpha-L-rhamnosidase